MSCQFACLMNGRRFRTSYSAQTEPRNFGCIQTSTILASKALCQRVPFTPDLKMHPGLRLCISCCRRTWRGVVMLPQPLAVWHHDHAYAHVGACRDWRYSLEWMNSKRSLFVPAAHSFCADRRIAPLLEWGRVASLAANSNDFRCATLAVGTIYSVRSTRLALKNAATFIRHAIDSVLGGPPRQSESAAVRRCKHE